MIIFWGTRRVDTVVDRVLEYCPVHRGLHEFDVVAVRMKRHLYGIAPGQGRLAGHEIHTDLPCGHVRTVDPAHIAAAPAEVRYADKLAEVAEQERLADSLDPTQRAATLREVMANVCTASEIEPTDKQVNAELKRPALIGFGASVLLLVLAIAFNSTILAVGFGAGVVVTFVVLVALSEIVKVRLRREALATAARFGIDPLRPTRAEVEAAAAWAESQGYARAKKLDIDRLVPS